MAVYRCKQGHKHKTTESSNECDFNLHKKKQAEAEWLQANRYKVKSILRSARNAHS